MQRDNRYDFYKGMLMLGVIFGHVLTALQNGQGGTFPLHAFIRTYDMPMYALISGYFLRSSCNRHSPVYNILGKIGGILFPAILWDVLFNLIGGTIAINIDRFWFLPAIFFCSVIIILADYIGKKTNGIATGIFLALAIFVFHTRFMENYNVGFLLVPCVFGYYMEDMKGMIVGSKLKNCLKFTVVFIFVVSWCFWKTDYSVWVTGCDILRDNRILTNMAIMLFRGLIGITGSLTMMWLWSGVYDCFSKHCCVDYICKIGRKTVELYILHSWLVTVAGARVVKILAELLGMNIFYFNERLLVLAFAPIVTVVTTLVVYYAQLYIKKIPVVGKYTFNLPLNARNNSNIKT